MKLNKKAYDISKSLKFKNPKLVDEGMGSLGYRIIRPGLIDEYLMSAKNWGSSNDTYSL